MFGYKHYVPMLKGKQGEFRALSHLPADIRSKLTPFFDITHPDDKWKNRIDEYLEKKVNFIQNSVGCNQDLFVDFYSVGPLQTSSGLHFVEFFFNELRKHNIWAIPVTGLERYEDYDNSVKEVIEKDKRGVCIRLLQFDIEECIETYKKINELLSLFEISPQGSHIILDFRIIRADLLQQYIDDTISFLHNFSMLSEWNSLTLAGSGFPESMAGIDKNSVTKIPRVELELWEKVITAGRRGRLYRLPAFGDYGICYPAPKVFKPSYTPSTKIRYTLSNCWLVVKGSGLKKKIDGRMSRDYSQFHNLAEKMSKHHEYYGQNYSFGDSYIFKCARDSIGPGNLTKWVEVDTNHHLTLVAQQIANSHVI